MTDQEKIDLLKEALAVRHEFGDCSRFDALEKRLIEVGLGKISSWIDVFSGEYKG